MCYDRNTARSSREHNDSNVVTLGGRLLTSNQAEVVLRIWLGMPLGGGRHAARLRKTTEIEKR
jgi:ribose 5-phosphate isomerase RpiB